MPIDVLSEGETHTAIALAIADAPVGIDLLIPEDYHGVQVTLDALLAGQAALLAGQAAIQATLEEMRNEIARMNNHQCSALEHPLMPIHVAAVPVPPNFPATMKELAHLSAARLVPILHYYGLPEEGSLPLRRRRVGAQLGVPMSFFDE
jgi:hypothetical protein